MLRSVLPSGVESVTAGLNPTKPIAPPKSNTLIRYFPNSDLNVKSRWEITEDNGQIYVYGGEPGTGIIRDEDSQCIELARASSVNYAGPGRCSYTYSARVFPVPDAVVSKSVIRFGASSSSDCLLPKDEVPLLSALAIAAISPNTVHLRIRIAFVMLIGGGGLSARRRSGKQLILRLTPRGLRRSRLETTRSCRISSRTFSWKAFLCRGGNSREEGEFSTDDSDGVQE
jgi:hypothetical protein